MCSSCFGRRGERLGGKAQYLAQTLLEHVGIEHRHLAGDDGEGQDVAVGAFAVAGKRADAVGMREGAGLTVDSAAYGWVGDFTAERAVDA